MVLDILTAIGLKETGKYVAKDVLAPLLQSSLEDYAKDFFKSRIADAAGLASQAPVQKALGEALKAFVELVEEELEFQGCSGVEIRDFYEVPLREFMKDKDAKATLGQAFEPDCRSIDAEVLTLRWKALDLRPLPEEFDWLQIGKQYVRAVKGILRSSNELRDLLKLHNQEAMRRGIEELVGIPPDFDLQKYQETLREQYGNLKLESLDTSACAYNNLELWHMFIPQNVRACQKFNPKVYEIPKEKFKELQQRGELDAEALEAAQIEAYRRIYMEQPIQNVLEVLGRIAVVRQQSRPVADHVVVLGDPGSGKSMLLQYVALQWAEQPIRDLKELAQRPLPLLIELRKYARDRNDKKCNSMVEYLHQGDIACRLNQQRLHEVLLAGDAIALFDGIDEVFDPHLRGVVVTDIHRFTNDYPQVQVVVTSRWLGYKAQTLRDVGFQHYMLQDLTDEQIAEFIARWHDQTFPEGADKVRKRERLHKAIRESKSIRELAGNPLLLTMMAILNRSQELPRNRLELYDQASQVLLHQWDVERNLIEQKLDPMTINYQDKQAMLRKVAFHMQSSKAGLAGNIISGQELEAILTDYLKSIDVDQPRDIARRMIQQLRTRNFILCDLGADNYAFVHRTFLDFFAARAFVWKFKETHAITFEELRDCTFGSHWYDETWHEVLCLICGMLDYSFSDMLIAYLMNEKFSEHSKHLLLAANCLKEVKHHYKACTTSTKLLSELKSVYEGINLRITRREYTAEEFMKERYHDTELISSLIKTIAEVWNESSNVLEWLMNQARTQDSDFIRTHILQCVQANWRPSPELFSFFAERALEDQSRHIMAPISNPSLMAAAILAEYYPHHNDTTEIILKKLKEDVDESARGSLLSYLLKIWGKGNKSFEFLCDYVTSHTLHSRVISSSHSSKTTALSLLAEHYAERSKTIDLLQDCVLNDPFERRMHDFQRNPRQNSLEILLKHYPGHPKTLELLQNCVQNDNDEQLREWAEKQLAKAVGSAQR
ncbi:NACHT domain-containing protein [Phormidium tenue]|uniref:NACHT domain-containing protein n=1 Tax=Phormidium tenue NIES-30 TaxID=549789 RepID=A0A1U7J681_9CYAN|nr:NACHT domain-containing protein [Phormidium tenue]MBD2232090.1 NACHT domain-containing protein [Phormidium tenue FACHB-1052]OKH48324.1 hypothetical protein NIES30_09820 [Phormidium tenue NIES-30]